MGKSSMNGPFSMAMLNYQRVIWHVLTHAAEVSSAAAAAPALAMALAAASMERSKE